MTSMLPTPFTLGRMRLRNRIVRSATHEGLASEHDLCTPELATALKCLGQNQVGLIISGHAYVSPEGRVRSRQNAIHSDDTIEPWKKALESIHATGAKVILQIAHAGGRAGDPALAAGPSPFVPEKNRDECREMTGEEVSRLPELFAAAAVRAQKAGFDGVQIHAAHGYLISQFLSGFYNHRTDAFGGVLENRARILYHIYDAIRSATGADYPILAKINSEDFVPGGFSAEECLTVCRELERRGLDAIELSGGIPEAGALRSPVRTESPAPGAAVYYEQTARALRAVLDMPLLLVGGIRDAANAERLLAEDVCDLVSLSRPLIREPDLAARWLAGNRDRAECISCNGCFRPIMTGRGLYCPVEKRLKTTSEGRP